MGYEYVQSVKRTTDILDILIFDDMSGDGFRLSELSQKTGLKPNTLHHILKTLVMSGYVEQKAGLKYKAGPKCKAIGIVNMAAGKSVMAETIRPVIIELGSVIEEKVVFAVLANGGRIPLIQTNDDNMIRIDNSIDRGSIYRMATGRILTAYCDGYEFEMIKKRWGYPGSVWDNISDDASLNNSIAEIRENGYVEIIEEDKGVISTGVPVFLADGSLAGALANYTPIYRCGAEKKKTILKELQAYSKKIGKILSSALK